MSACTLGRAQLLGGGRVHGGGFFIKGGEAKGRVHVQREEDSGVPLPSLRLCVQSCCTLLKILLISCGDPGVGALAWNPSSWKAKVGG